MVELYSSIFSMLRLAKRLHDCSLAEKMPYCFQSLTLDEDFYYELAYNATSIVFEDTIQDYNEDDGVEVYVFCDPIIDKFCQLCWQYEQRRHLTEAENPYRKRIEAIIHMSFELSGYNYDFDWRLSANDRGRRRIIFFYYEEFCSLDELPEALIEIRDGFLGLNLELEKALSNLAEQNAREKEAA